jgi:RNA-directed DNA polymerase
MSEKRQKNQLELAFMAEKRSEASRAIKEGTESLVAERSAESPAISEALMEEVIEGENLKQALGRVKANKGSPGVDGMMVEELTGYLKEHWPSIREHLLSGIYKAQPVKRVEIAKPGGGIRKLGIPTVLDRFIQQAVMQVLQRRWDPTFSQRSSVFVLAALLIRRWPKRSSMSPAVIAGWWISIWRSFSIESTTTS